uniref:Uncharacterized protein n=1 Tax=Oryza meridionalis TaxID=40149 RepID=A0A0E0EUK3_9ORYZ
MPPGHQAKDVGEHELRRDEHLDSGIPGLKENAGKVKASIQDSGPLIPLAGARCSTASAAHCSGHGQPEEEDG